MGRERKVSILTVKATRGSSAGLGCLPAPPPGQRWQTQRPVPARPSALYPAMRPPPAQRAGTGTKFSQTVLGEVGGIFPRGDRSRFS